MSDHILTEQDWQDFLRSMIEQKFTKCFCPYCNQCFDCYISDHLAKHWVDGKFVAKIATPPVALERWVVEWEYQQGKWDRAVSCGGIYPSQDAAQKAIDWHNHCISLTGHAPDVMRTRQLAEGEE